MEIIKAKSKISTLLEQLQSCSVVINDGADECDCEQNSAFAVSDRSIDSVIRTIAAINIDDVDCDKLWYDAWEGIYEPHLPESKYSHAIAYCQAILGLGRYKYGKQ